MLSRTRPLPTGDRNVREKIWTFQYRTVVQVSTSGFCLFVMRELKVGT